VYIKQVLLIHVTELIYFHINFMSINLLYLYLKGYMSGATQTCRTHVTLSIGLIMYLLDAVKWKLRNMLPPLMQILLLFYVT